jgi:hypothetical protein
LTTLLGTGCQVLFGSQHDLIGSEKSNTLQKLAVGQPEPNTQKETFLKECSLKMGRI